MKILVINCGSSSVKYTLFDMPAQTVLADGVLEKVGEAGSRLTHEAGGTQTQRACSAPDHAAALQVIADVLARAGTAAIGAVGHRVVHGGDRFTAAARIDGEVTAAIRRFAELAPLHNPPNLAGIRAAAALFPDALQAACFDTAFHQSMPERAYLYAIPYALYRERGFRRYGFHGASHRYVAGRTADRLGLAPEGVNCITCHLGNGCSLAAVRGGRSVDTSMGMTPLEGLVMGTRSGDLDPAIPLRLIEHAGMSPDAVDDLLNRHSGLRGLSGHSNDMRDILTRAQSGDRRARLALDVFCYRLKKYIGAYAAVLGRLDALVFTGGIGENAPAVRAGACEGLGLLGIELDPQRNQAPADGERAVGADGAPVAVLVIPTDEEAAIAQETYALATASDRGS